MSPIRLGVIGLSAQGWAAMALIPPLFDPLLKDKYTITAVATSSEASARASVAKYSELTGHTVKGYYGESGAKELANDPNVDLVVVSVKVPDHWAAVSPALEEGKDIYVEWSPGKNFEETQRIADGAKAKGLRTFVGAQYSHSATTRKVEELIKGGKVGKVLSTSTYIVVPPEIGFGGKATTKSSTYTLDVNNGTTLLTNIIGHHLANMRQVLGDITEISATSAVLFPDVRILDDSGKPTGEVHKKTAPDQVVLTGRLGGEHDGAIVTIHVQAGPPTGRFTWLIDGEEGSIEVKNRPENGPYGVFLAVSELKVGLNGEEIALDVKEEDRLGNTGKAWLEYAKGSKEGRYDTLEDSLAVWRVLDGALRSIADDGKTIRVAQA
ncbi:NAD-binding Rossmann fold oxidoreductase [Irpex lacteus]|nr:NAD-binding Rossmann fold oxidoreductase [Irpex lacteus]